MKLIRIFRDCNRSEVDPKSKQVFKNLNIKEVQATISPENHWDFHGGEMETSMVMAIHPETVRLELSETGYKDGGYKGKKILNFSGEAAISWMGEDLRTREGKPIGIGGDPRGATAEKGGIIFRRSAEKLAKALLGVQDWDINA